MLWLVQLLSRKELWRKRGKEDHQSLRCLSLAKTMKITKAGENNLKLCVFNAWEINRTMMTVPSSSHKREPTAPNLALTFLPKPTEDFLPLRVYQFDPRCYNKVIESTAA